MTAKEASNLIEKALNEAVTSNEGNEQGDIILDWVVVCYVANPDKEVGGGYPMFFSNGELPNYRAKGLLIEGLMRIGE